MQEFLSCIHLPKRSWNLNVISYFLAFPDKTAHRENVLGEAQKAACQRNLTQRLLLADKSTVGFIAHLGPGVRTGTLVN